MAGNVASIFSRGIQEPSSAQAANDTATGESVSQPSSAPGIRTVAAADSNLHFVQHIVSEMPYPPTSTTERWPFIGSFCYSMTTDFKSEWVIHTITNLTQEYDDQSNCIEMFDVVTDIDNVIRQTKVASDGIAYLIPHPDQLHIGHRVIAAVDPPGRGSKKKFYSGIIAQLHDHPNGFRYLIFFEMGHVQNCCHEDVRLVYESRDGIGEYFTESIMSQCMIYYLEKYPHEPLFNTDVGSLIAVKCDGIWMNAKINAVSNSSVEIIYEDDGKRERINSGSYRLMPVFKRLEAIMLRFRNPNIASDASSNSSRQLTATQFFGDETIIPNSSAYSCGEDVGETDSSSATCAVGAPTSLANSSQEPDEPIITFSTTVRSCIPKVIHPRSFFEHKCSKSCVTWVKYSEEKIRGVSLLAIPAIFAFRREQDPSKRVVYISPCGVRLGNLKQVQSYLSKTQIPLTLDMFDFGSQTNIFNQLLVDPKFEVLPDISFGAEKIPIPCINTSNNESPNLQKYLTESRAIDGVFINTDPGFLVCCDCKGNCRDKLKCRCSKLTVDNYRPFAPKMKKGNFKNIGYRYQRLNSNVLSGIYECNSQCKCNPATCMNRVVQHGIRHKLQLFKTDKKGWGVRTAVDIPKGVFISTFIGEIMTDSTADSLGLLRGDEYLTDLDQIEVMEQHKADWENDADSKSCQKNNQRSKIPKKRKSNSNLRQANGPSTSAANNPENDEGTGTVRNLYGPNEAVYVLDTLIAGNISRFFNHSCDPNMVVQNVFVETHDLRFPVVSFFSSKHIPAGTELTWDYCYTIGEFPKKVQYCYCDAKNCRKRLY